MAKKRNNVNDLNQVERLQIAPNPSSSSVSFNFHSAEIFKNYRLTVTDMMGKQVAFILGNVSSLNVNGANELKKLKAGIYYIAISDGNKIVVSTKIIRF